MKTFQFYFNDYSLIPMFKTKMFIIEIKNDSLF